MIFVVYADDSADAKREIIFTVGGFMGFPEMFVEAERNWKAYLDKSGLEYFKASEAQGLHGQFDPKRLQKEPCDAREFADETRSELGKIIAAEHLGGIALSLEMKAFQKVLREQNDAEVYFGTSDCYIYMFRQFIIYCIDMMNKDWPLCSLTQIVFVFDNHSKWKEAEKSYQKLRNDPLIAPRLGNISHADDKVTIALQMADLCAYEARYKTMTFLGQADERPEFVSMDAKDAWYSIAIFREKELLQNLETARKAGRWLRPVVPVSVTFSIQQR
ncbi:MAG: DUF3800 domain-containing protein [Terracidiphilus sp.]